MLNDLSTFEMQIISGLLSKHPDDYIAMVIDKPTPVVRNAINELTGGGTLRKVYVEKAEVKKQVRIKKNIEKENSLDRERAIAKQKRLAIDRESEVKRSRRAEPLFKTKVVDYSQMITVRIDHRTCIQVRADADIQLAKNNFLKTYRPYAAPPENPWQKFKPGK